MKCHYIVLFIILCFFACQQKNKNGNLKEITVIPTNAESKFLSELLDTFFIVKLPTEPLFGEIKTIKIIDSIVFLSDYYRNRLHIYDIRGKYINTLHEYGRGPGEYSGILTFSYDRYNKQIIVNDREHFNHYSFPDLKFIKRSKGEVYEDYYINFEILDEKHWFMISDSELEGNCNKEVGSFCLNIENNDVFRYDMDNDFLSIESSVPSVITRCEDKFYYVYPFEYSIVYEITPEKSVPLYKISFDKSCLEGKFWKINDVNMIEEKISTDPYALIAQFVINNEKTLQFWYVYGEPDFKSLQLGMFNKQNGTVKNVQNLKIGGIANNILPDATYNDYYVSLIIPESLDIDEEKISTSIGQTILNEVEMLEKNDVAHPLLLFYRLK